MLVHKNTDKKDENKKMEGKKFPWFSEEYHLEKRPRYSKSSYPDDQMPSTSSAFESSSHRLTPAQQMSIKRNDEKLLLWQERQIVECIKENMVNQMVESYMSIGRDDFGAHATGSQQDEERVREGHLTTYHAERVRQRFENSAVVKAIGQYGLQKYRMLHSYQLFDDDNQMETMSTSSSSISLSSPPDSPTSRSDWCPFTPKNAVHTPTTPATQSFNDIVAQRNDSDLVGNASHDKCNNESQCCDTDPSSDEHFNFLEAAVSVAIQEKGLVPYTMQKSPNR